jgi:hypothetical protein
MQDTPSEKPLRGRPPSGIKRTTTKVSTSAALYEKAKQLAARNGESYSQFATRALQILILESEK